MLSMVNRSFRDLRHRAVGKEAYMPSLFQSVWQVIMIYLDYCESSDANGRCVWAFATHADGRMSLHDMIKRCAITWACSAWYRSRPGHYLSECVASDATDSKISQGYMLSIEIFQSNVFEDERERGPSVSDGQKAMGSQRLSYCVVLIQSGSCTILIFLSAPAWWHCSFWKALSYTCFLSDTGGYLDPDEEL